MLCRSAPAGDLLSPAHTHSPYPSPHPIRAQEVSVLAADGASARFVWRLGMGAQGCWMVTGIFTQADLAQEGWQQRHHI